MPNLLKTVNGYTTTVGTLMNNFQLTVPVASVTGLSSVIAGQVIISRGVAGLEERVNFNNVSGGALIVPSGGRGADGTTPYAHQVGEPVELVVSAAYQNGLVNNAMGHSNDDGSLKAGLVIQSPIYRDINGWIDCNETWIYASSTTVTVTGDVSGRYEIGDKVKFVQSGITNYCYIVGVSYSSPNTTITLLLSSDYPLTNNPITSNYYSKSVSPKGFPSKLNYIPTMTGRNAMTISSLSISYAEFWMIGRIITINLSLTFTVGGTPDIEVYASLPYPNYVTTGYGGAVVNNNGYVCNTIEVSNSGAGFYGGTALTTNWTAGTGRQVVGTGSYRV